MSSGDVSVRIYMDSDSGSDSDSDSHEHRTISKLGNDNYLTWSFRMEMLLRFASKKLRLADMLTASAPPATASSDEIRAFQNRVKWAVHYLKQGLDTWQIQKYGLDGKPSEIDIKATWEKIREDCRRALHAWSLRRQLYGARLENFKDLASYTAEIDALVHKYSFAVGHNLSNDSRAIPVEEWTWLYVNGLPESWNEWKTMWIIDKKYMTDRDMLYQSMRLCESSLEGEKEDEKQERKKQGRMRQKQDQRKPDIKIRCFLCKQVGHIQTSCPN